jgi:hypothetical protein
MLTKRVCFGLQELIIDTKPVQELMYIFVVLFGIVPHGCYQCFDCSSARYAGHHPLLSRACLNMRCQATVLLHVLQSTIGKLFLANLLTLPCFLSE